MGKIYRGSTAATAIAICNFLVTLMTGINFYVAVNIPLQAQILIIIGFLFFMVLGIFKVDNTLREKEQGELQESTPNMYNSDTDNE